MRFIWIKKINSLLCLKYFHWTFYLLDLPCCCTLLNLKLYTSTILYKYTSLLIYSFSDQFGSFKLCSTTNHALLNNSLYLLMKEKGYFHWTYAYKWNSGSCFHTCNFIAWGLQSSPTSSTINKIWLLFHVYQCSIDIYN